MMFAMPAVRSTPPHKAICLPGTEPGFSPSNATLNTEIRWTTFRRPLSSFIIAYARRFAVEMLHCNRPATRPSWTLAGQASQACSPAMPPAQRRRKVK